MEVDRYKIYIIVRDRYLCNVRNGEGFTSGMLLHI